MNRYFFFIVVLSLIGLLLVIFGSPSWHSSGIVILAQAGGIATGFIWSMEKVRAEFEPQYKAATKERSLELDKIKEKHRELQASYDEEIEKLVERDKKYSKLHDGLVMIYKEIDGLVAALNAARDTPEVSYDCNVYRETIDSCVYTSTKKIVAIVEERTEK